MEIIGRAWLKTFIADLKAIVRSFQNTALLYYQSFSDLVVKKARELHEDDPYWRSLPRYDHTFESRIRGIAQSIESFVRSKQKDMSRRFMPTFQMKMAEVYTDCVEIKGRLSRISRLLELILTRSRMLQSDERENDSFH